MTDFKDMPAHSRVWVYQSSRELSPAEIVLIKSKCRAFVSEWTSHNRLMHACIEIFHNRFIVVCVDEQTAPASGCGIDKSVRFILDLEKELGISLTDRMNVAFRTSNGAIGSCALSELKFAEAMTVFNNLVQTKEELEKSWEVPIEQSWHKQFT